jgi:hypothetical protein
MRGFRNPTTADLERTSIVVSLNSLATHTVEALKAPNTFKVAQLWSQRYHSPSLSAFHPYPRSTFVVC